MHNIRCLREAVSRALWRGNALFYMRLWRDAQTRTGRGCVRVQCAWSSIKEQQRLLAARDVAGQEAP